MGSRCYPGFRFVFGVFIAILGFSLAIIRCGSEGGISDESIVEPQLVDEIEVVQEGGLLRIRSTIAGSNEHTGGANRGSGITPEATEVTTGITYTILGIPGGNPCTAVQTGGVWRTCCDLQITNNTGAEISGVVLIGWQALSGSPSVGRSGGNNSGYDGAGTGWRTTDGVNTDPSANGGWTLWLKGAGGGETIPNGGSSSRRRICLQSPTGYSVSYWKLYKDCPSGRVREQGSNKNLTGWARLGDVTPDSNYPDLGSGNYVTTDPDGYYAFPEIGATNFIHNVGAECHQSLRTETVVVYLESFLPPGGSNCWLRIHDMPPSGRDDHTAVWTGSEMIVWGGSDGTYTNTGGRYNPSTDSWTPTSTTGAPSGREDHTAVWTGSEMIVWGGYDGSSYLNTGGRYNPSTDSWQATSTTGAPSGRRWHTAVWTGSEMIVWGGYYYSGGGYHLNTGGRYNPSTDSWTPTSTTGAPSGRHWHTAVWTGSEMIVWGGYDGSSYLNTGGRYNPSTDSWQATSTITFTNIFYQDGFETGDFSALPWVTGGSANWYVQSVNKYEGNYAAESGTITHNQITYLEVTLSFTEPGIVAFYRSVSSEAGWDYLRFKIDGVEAGKWSGTVGWGEVWYSFGAGTHTFRWEYTKDGSVSSGSDKAWIDKVRWGVSSGGAPTERAGHTAVWTGSEMIVWGGYDGSSYLNTGGRYNPSTDSWTSTSTSGAPTGRDWHTAVWTGSEMIIWGGSDVGYFNTGGRYNPASDSWVPTTTTGAPTGRSGHTAVWTGSEMIVWGGYPYTNTGGRYNPSTDSWTATSTSGAPTGRVEHTAVWTGSEMIVWGGYNGSSFLNTGGRYNPSTDSWLPTSTTGAPIARRRHTAVWTGSEMIVWGGYNGSYLNTGGRFNPSTDSWTATSTINAPTGREDHTAVWTGTEMVVWGGGDGSNRLNTGGRYNPSTDSWTATSTINAPTGRYYHTAVWTGSEMIVWGGSYLNTGGRYWP